MVEKMSWHTSPQKSIDILNDAYRHSIHQNDEKAIQPTNIKTVLRNHQKSILFSMTKREIDLNSGMDISGVKLYSSYAILGDSVGVGKSLMVLGHISNLKQLDPISKINTLSPSSTSSFYSIHQTTVLSDLSNAGCLIVVPHTLYKQWEGYIKTDTTLSYYGVKTKSFLEKTRWVKDEMMKKDVVLISNTLYGKFNKVMKEEKIHWKRVFYDEADTLHISSTQELPETKFTWFISASWPNLLFPNHSYYYTTHVLNAYITNPRYDTELVKQLQESKKQISSGTNHTYQRYYMISPVFFKYFLGTSHELRGRLVLRCRDTYVQESISLPPLTIQNIMCMPSIIQRVLANAISPQFKLFLHAGDYLGALESIGVKAEDSTTLITAVSEQRLKELDRLQKTYKFKSEMEYATPKAKEDALKSLKQKIDSLEEQIKTLKERVENYKEEICPICFDEPQNAVLTQCCSRIFCAGCMLTSMTRLTTCPMCREPIHPSQLKAVGSTTTHQNTLVQPKKKEEEKPLKKMDQLIKTIKNILKETPEAQLLIFSRYDNTFIDARVRIEEIGLTTKQVYGNKDVINSTLKSFEKGTTRVLLLNSLLAGAGLNITTATHVILFHAMNHEEEKQILGRAYRIGRTGPLQMIRLLHPEELTDTHS